MEKQKNAKKIKNAIKIKYLDLLVITYINQIQV